MRVAIYHNLPDGGAIRALYELVKHSYGEVEYDLYQLAPFDKSSRYDFQPYVKARRSYNFSYNPSKLDIFTEMMTRFYRLRQLQKRIAQEIDSKSYDVVFVHHCAIAQTPFLLGYLKTKSLYFIQEPRRLSFEKDFYESSKLMIPKALRAPWSLRQSMLKDLDMKNARRCTAALCNSHYAKANIANAYGVDAEVCYLGIDPEQFSHKKTTKKNQIVVVGTLHPAKSQHLAIRSLAKTSMKDRVRLILVYENYDERYLAELEDLASALNVKVAFRQGVPDGELAQIYRESKLTLAVAAKEPFGFTPIESAACGTPTVAVREGGYLETVIDGKNGILCDRNEQSIADAVSKGMRVEWDSEKMSRAARTQWSWKASAQTYMQVLKELTGV